MLLVFYTKATTKANTALLVGSTQWLWYLHSIGLGRKSQSPGGMYLPHLIRESSRMKGSQWHKFTLPHCVPTQTSLGEGSEAHGSPAQPPAGWHPFCHHLGCISLPPLSPKPPQTTPWLHISTLFRHNPQAPPSTTCVYRIRACGFTPKPNRKTPRLPALLRGWRNWAMVPGDDHSWWCFGGAAVYEPCPEQLFPVWELVVGKTGRLQIWLPAPGLTGWWWKAMPSLISQNKGKKPETAEGTELKATNGSDKRRGACCWVTQLRSKCHF